MFFNKLLYSIIEALVRVVRGWSLRERESRLECIGGGVVTAGRRDQGRKKKGGVAVGFFVDLFPVFSFYATTS